MEGDQHASGGNDGKVDARDAERLGRSDDRDLLRHGRHSQELVLAVIVAVIVAVAAVRESGGGEQAVCAIIGKSWC